MTYGLAHISLKTGPTYINVDRTDCRMVLSLQKSYTSYVLTKGFHYFYFPEA